MTLPTARDFHNGDFKAQVAPQNDTIAFADDGSNYGEGCQVRMQRIGPWLAVVDNSGCGGGGGGLPRAFCPHEVSDPRAPPPLARGGGAFPIMVRSSSSFR